MDGSATGTRPAVGSVSAAYVVSYAPLSLPSLAAGLVAPSWGLETTGYLYIAFVGVLSLSAAVHAGRHRAPRAGPTAAEPLVVAQQGGTHPQRPHSAEDRPVLERN